MFQIGFRTNSEVDLVDLGSVSIKLTLKIKLRQLMETAYNKRIIYSILSPYFYSTIFQ